jgi:hypothetical protein
VHLHDLSRYLWRQTDASAAWRELLCNTGYTSLPGRSTSRLGARRQPRLPHRQPWEIYDLATDPTEMQDRAKQQPDRVKAMSTQWQSWADDVGVLPWQDLPMSN